jgi:Carboxypeptidase regulatory-like domain/TonB dependent receptor
MLAFAWGLLVATLLVAAPALAQTDARIVGSVRDQTGAFVAGADVTVVNQATGQTRAAVTNAQGYFIVTGLKPAVYTVRVASTNFAPTEYTDLKLQAAQELPLDFEIRPQGLTESVQVSADISALDLSSARIGTNVIEREVKDLPLNGRQLSQLYLQAPGSVNSGTGTFGDIRFSGRAVEQNIVRYDGVEGTAIIDASPGNLNGELPSPFRLQSSLENVQEFRVESSNYPAEYGTGTGGQITVVSKSGSNQVHGSLFEYHRGDNFDSRNYFDIQKSPLKLNQFGGSVGAPLAKDRTFVFASYEGYRLDAGINFVEAAPSAAAFARAVDAIKPLYDAFRGPGSVMLAGKSNNPDFDILQLQSVSTVKEDSFNVRLDHKFSTNWSIYGRYFRDQGTNDQPEGVTGRRSRIEAKPANGFVALQGVLSGSMLNELKFGYNAAPTSIDGVAPTVNGIDLSRISLNLTGSVANTGIAGQGASSGIAVPGGLLRQNSAANGRGTPYDPYSLSVIDTLSWTRGRHNIKFGGEARFIRMSTDRLGGTTYTFANLNDFLANRGQQIQYLGDLSEASVFNGGVTGDRTALQDYAIGFAQDEWKVGNNVTLNVGLRYEYYTPLREKDDHDVIFDIETGTLKDPGTSFYHSKTNNFQPRVGLTWAPGSGRTVLRGGFGIFVGPGQTEDQIQPIESDRISSTLTGGQYPIDPAVLRANFINNPNNRSYQPRAYANEYTIPERVYQYSASVQHELPWKMVATAAYVGSQGRNLFLRNFTNRIVDVRTNADPTKNAVIIRQFDIVNGSSILKPYAEIDFKTSGGHDSYNSMQLSLARRVGDGLTLNSQYTLGRSYGNTAGSNEALTAGNPFDYDYDLGYNAFDVRHTFNLSALYSLPVGAGHKFLGDAKGLTQAILGGWDVGGIVNARSGLPIDVRVTRPDVVYVDAAGNVYGSPAAGRSAIINTPGGGASRNVRRPNLIPGVDPYLRNGLQWLNPAAFSIPAPGEFGNLKRGELRGPSFKQVDFLATKRFSTGGGSNVEVRWEIFNLLNTNNFSNPVATLPSALGTSTNQIQPSQPFTSGAAGTFGSLTSTVGRTVGLGTNRQMQFALRFNF